MSLRYGPGVVQWVETQLGAVYGNLAQGIGWEQNGHFVAGVVYEGYNGANIYVHIAKLRGVRLSPTFIAAMFDYPFRQLKVRRISATIADRNERSKEFARKLGGRLEGVLEDALPDGNLCIFGLLRKDAEKWLTEPYRRRLEVADGRSSQRIFRISERSRQQSRQAASSARA